MKFKVRLSQKIEEELGARAIGEGFIHLPVYSLMNQPSVYVGKCNYIDYDKSHRSNDTRLFKDLAYMRHALEHPLAEYYNLSLKEIQD